MFVEGEHGLFASVRQFKHEIGYDMSGYVMHQNDAEYDILQQISTSYAGLSTMTKVPGLITAMQIYFKDRMKTEKTEAHFISSTVDSMIYISLMKNIGYVFEPEKYTDAYNAMISLSDMKEKIEENTGSKIIYNMENAIKNKDKIAMIGPTQDRGYYMMTCGTEMDGKVVGWLCHVYKNIENIETRI